MTINHIVLNMLYPQNFEQKIGFDQIRIMLINRCISTLGKYFANKMGFSSNYQAINVLLDQTEEFRQIILSGENFPASNYYDPFEVFERIKTPGTFAESDELNDLRASLITIREVLSFLKKTSAETRLRYPVLNGLSEQIIIDPIIFKELTRILDEKGLIRSNASDNLSFIRKMLSQLENQAGQRINQILAQARKDGLISADIELALRNGRLVIPVPVAYKRKIKGFVHDQSATGQTVFIEPEEIFEINNEIRELELEERREIIRILKEFADFIRPMLTSLKEAYRFLGKIDFIRAKANLSLEMDAARPKVNNQPMVNWTKAKHPLLWLAYKPLKKHVEPLELNLNPEQHIIVISGPNAGGKSVCLKTAGLVQYMLQCGLLIPMADYSEAGIFKKIFIDIGDQQSLENDLSTYSSHLANMKLFLENADSHTLFLIDEFGAGTEPRLGGAIAESILDELSNKKSFGVITTHYANLKILAGKKAGILNGSMLFDTGNMRPLYKLKTGNPGSSFAFEIARTMGIPEYLLEKAANIAGTEHIDFERQLQDLELKKIELDEKEKQLKSGDAFLSELIDKYQHLNEKLESQKSQIISEARLEAKKILADANKMIEKTIKEIRESAADKEKTKTLRNELAGYSNIKEGFIEPHHPEQRASKKKKEKTEKEDREIQVIEGPVNIGDFVKIQGQQAIGEVLEKGEKDAVVAVGGMRLKTSLKLLQKVSKTMVKQSEIRVKIKYDFDINEKATEFSPNLDIRGKRAEEALVQMRRFVDDAILLGVKQLKVIHGTGDGILREVIRDYLRTINEIKRVRDEHPDRGGAGSTIIEIK